MEERHAMVGGINMRWEETGEGAPVVLLHGIPTSPALWRRVTPQAKNARLLAWELVGFGASWQEGLDRDISMKAQADYLLAWLDSQKIERAVLVGHDLGGAVAQIVSVRQPLRTAGLVLTNSVCYDAWPIPTFRAIRSMRNMAERTPPNLFRTAFSTLMRKGHDSREVADESIDLHWRNYDHEGGVGAFLRQVSALTNRDTVEIGGQLSSLRVPAAVVWGVRDIWLRPRHGRRLAVDLRGQLDEVAGARHFVPENHPDRVLRAVTSLLGRLHH